MRVVKWTDDKGYMRARSIPDSAPDEMAMLGIPEESPDVNQLDWEMVKRTLHNQLMARHLITKGDVDRSQVGVTAAVRAALVKPLLALYREEMKIRGG